MRWSPQRLDARHGTRVQRVAFDEDYPMNPKITKGRSNTKAGSVFPFHVVLSVQRERNANARYYDGMTVTRKLARWGALRAARRVAVSVPFAGTAIALLVAGAAIRRKGVIGGVLETALNATPFVGAAKNAVEMYRGDFIPDKRRRPGTSSSSAPVAPGDRRLSRARTTARDLP